jgi:hypothetical protein
MKPRPRLLLLTALASLLACASAPATTAAGEGDAVAQATPEDAPVNDLRATYERWVRDRGGDVSAITACPELDAGAFRCFRGGTADYSWVSAAGVVDPGTGAGDWPAFLQEGDAAEVHKRLEKMGASRMLQAVTPESYRPSRVSDAEWSLVSAPEVVPYGPGGFRFTGWFGYPPSFAPFRFTVEALPGGQSAVMRTEQAHALVAATTSDADKLAALLDTLEGADRMAQKRAADELGDLGAGEAVPGLVALLSSPWDQARQAAAAALGKIGDPDAVPALEAAIRAETDTWIATAMLAGLNGIPGDAATAAIKRLSEDHPNTTLQLQAQGLAMSRG